MSSYAQARDTIARVVVDEWVAANPTIKVFFDNTSTKDLDTLEKFLSCEIAFHDSKQVSLGVAPALRAYGTLNFVVACKGGTGYRDSLTKADDLSAMFRFRKIDGLVFSAPHLTSPKEEGSWFYLNVVIPFFFDS